MFYLEQICNFCEGGELGFRKCSDKKTIVIVCDECYSVWLDPNELEKEKANFPKENYYLEVSNCNVFGGHTEWAKLEEIKGKNWDKFIAGDGKASWEKR